MHLGIQARIHKYESNCSDCCGGCACHIYTPCSHCVDCQRCAECGIGRDEHI